MRALAVLAVCFVALALVWVSTRRERALPPEIGEIRAVSSPVAELLAPVERGEGSPSRVEVAKDAAQVPTVEPAVTDLASPAPAARCALAGRVLDDEGTPVGDALVVLIVLGKGMPNLPRATVHADADGRFAYEVASAIPSDARVKLSISATSFHASASYTLPGGWAEGANDLGDFLLPRCGVLSGRIIDSMGAPIESAMIELSPAPNGRITALTTPKGAFRMRDLSAGSCALEARAIGYMPRAMKALAVRVGEETVVPDIVLAPAPSIRGSVVDDEGRAVNSMRIEGRSVRTGEKSTTNSKEDGSFVLFLPSDDLTVLGVSGNTRGYADWGGKDGPGVTFSAGAIDVRIVLEHLPRMRFVVVDSLRQPIERFELTLTEIGRGVWNPPQERVPLVDHPRGEVRLPLRTSNRVVVRAPKYVPVRLPIVADAASSDVQTIRLEPAATITGRLTLAGNPIAKGNVSLALQKSPANEHLQAEARDDLGDDPFEKRTKITQRDGIFEFNELCAGTYTLEAKGDGAASTTLRDLVVANEQSLNLGDIALPPAALVRGVVLTDSGESSAEFRLRLDNRSERAVPTRDAHFEFKNVAAGAHTLVWSRSDENPLFVAADSRTVRFEIAAGESRDIVIDARPSTPCSLTIRVLRNGAPVPDVAVHVSFEEMSAPLSSKLLTQTDENGIATASLDPHRMIRLEVVNDADHRLGSTARMLTLVPGGHVEEVIHIETGRLVVELPESLSLPTDGQVMLGFRDQAQLHCNATRGAMASERSWPPEIAWTSRTLDFGEYAAGRYDISLSFGRLVRDDRPTNPTGKLVEWMRDHYENPIEIRNGAVTRIVVP